jgi:Ca-activated chloride channel family protein
LEVKFPLYFIVSLVFVFAYLFRFFQFRKKPEFYVPKQLWKKKGRFYRYLNLLMGLAGTCLIGFSLTQPRSPLGFAKNEIKVNDIFIVVDVSRSMLAEDFAPNRLESAKKKIREFVKLRPTDRIGIVMFSERAFTLLPLSTDLALIEQIIDDIKVGFLGMGTNIGDALGLAVGRAAQSIAKSKVIILLTDGVSNVGNMTPEQSADEAKKQGVKVYTIGIGQKANGALLKTGRGRGRYQRIPGGSVDLETLDMIANKTGGKSYYASDESALAEVLSEIQNLEKTEIETSAKIIYKELYWNYLAWGLVLLLLSEVFSMVFLREIL